MPWAVAAALGGLAMYRVLRRVADLRLDAEAEFNGAALGMRKVSATAERETNGWSG